MPPQPEDPDSPSTSSATTSAAELETLLPQLYYNASLPSSYGGIDALVKASGGSRNQVAKWLQTQWTYTLHKPARKKFPHRRYMVRNMDMQWQADLVEMQPYARENKGYRYLLTVIDIFSRYAWALPLKDKSAASLLAAWKKLFAGTQRRPRLLQTDQGLEFENRQVRAYLGQLGIEQFSVKSPHKAAMVERFNRTLKARMWRAFTRQGSYKWLQLLPQLLTAYNNSRHRVLGRAPSQVNRENEADVWIHLYGKDGKPRRRTKFAVGDRVRLSKHKATFDKGYTPNWSEEEFIVHTVNKKFSPVMYTVRSLAGEVIEGGFYDQELQAVTSSEEIYRIDKVLRTRGTGKHKQALVRWRGYEREQPTWIPYSQLQRVQDVASA